MKNKYILALAFLIFGLPVFSNDINPISQYYSTLEISEQKKNFSFPLTNIEKSWLKSIVQDERFPLFVNGKTYENIVKKLSDIEPLYDEKMFRYYDQYADGDEYKNKYYIKNFRILSDATDKKIPVKIIYQSTKKNKISVGHYIPIKLEYSQKDDKFRVYTIKISDGKRLDSVCLNIGRIIEVKPSNKTYKGKIDVELDMKIFERLEHAEIEIYNERNAIERFMIEFSTDSDVYNIYWGGSNDQTTRNMVCSFDSLLPSDPKREWKQVKLEPLLAYNLPQILDSVENRIKNLIGER